MTWAQQIYEHILFAIAWPVLSLITPSSQINIFFLPSSLALVIAFYVWRHRRYGKIKMLRLLRYLFPRKIFLHASAVLDYKYFVANRMVRALVYAPLLLSSALYERGLLAGLTALFGPGHLPAPASWGPTALATIVFIIAFDFAYWFAHWLLHRLPVLWEFHKVHHAAEVLTPITALRAHPVEELLNINMIALMTGASHGLVVYLYGAGAQQFSLLQLNLFLMLYFLTLYHLRHSHVWLHFGKPWNYVFLSPAQHQIHHSTALRHRDKNLGYLFSIWDHIFGTVYVPERREHLKLGIGIQGREFNTLWRLYVVPFVKVARRWSGWRKARRSKSGAQIQADGPSI